MYLVLCPDEDLNLPCVRLEPNVDLLESANAKEYWLIRLGVQLRSSVGAPCPPPPQSCCSLSFSTPAEYVPLWVSCSKYILLDK